MAVGMEVIMVAKTQTKSDVKLTLTLDVEQAGDLLSSMVTSTERHRCLLEVMGELEKFVKKHDKEKHEKILMKHFIRRKLNGD